MPSPDLMPPSPDITQVSPGFDNTIGGNHGHLIIPSGGVGSRQDGYLLLGQDYDDPGAGVSPSTTWDDGNPHNWQNMPQEGYEGSDRTPVEPWQDTTGLENGKDESNVVEDYSSGASLSQFLQEHPGVSYQDAMKYMAQYSEEWAEKYIDYIAEQEGLNEAREYSAQREDTAYQRLVADLKAAGLNPAMMYGSSASPLSPSGSLGYVKTTEGATSRGISNNSKIQKLLLAWLQYEFQKAMGITNSVFDGVDTVFNAIGKFIPLFGK